MIRRDDPQDSVAAAFDDWCLNEVSSLIDAVADGHPQRGRTFESQRKLAGKDVRMMPRLVKLAQAILDKYDRGELTQEEAKRLNGTTDEEP